jgi:organic radical activating enzyme
MPISTTNKAICAAFYKHTNIRFDGKVHACCRSDIAIKQFDGDLDGLLHSKEYNEIREKTSRGEKISTCSKCYLEEEHGKESMRMRFNSMYPDAKVELQDIEIYPNNICNLTCEMCLGEFSSAKWTKSNPDKPSKDGIKILPKLPTLPSTIRKIKFMGGEPFMTNSHRKILQTIDNGSLKNLKLEYTTNGHFLLTEEDHKIFKQCSNVEISVSIDAFGDLNSIVREGADWNKIDKFVDDIIQNTNYDIFIYTTLHNKGWSNIDKLGDWYWQKKLNIKNKNRLGWDIIPLVYPDKLSIRHLPDSDKQKLNKWINVWGKEIANIDNGSYIISLLKRRYSISPVSF